MNCNLVFADGTELIGLQYDPITNVIVSQTEITKNILTDEACETVIMTVTDGQEEMKTTLRYVKWQLYQRDDEWHLVLVGASSEEIKIKELEAQNTMLLECLMEMSEIVYA